jgi:hypothetical protein
MKDGLLDNFVLFQKPKHEAHLYSACVQEAFLQRTSTPERTFSQCLKKLRTFNLEAYSLPKYQSAWMQLKLSLCSRLRGDWRCASPG